MGKLLRVPGSTALGSSFRRFNDAGPHVTPGHLTYIDFHHSQQALTGVPTTGATIRNLARKEAAALCELTSADLADLDWTFTLGGATGATQLQMERTTKGGLHMMVSRTAGTTATWAAFTAPSAIRQYFADNPNHRYIAILCRRITRNQATATTTQQDLKHFEIASLTAGRDLLSASQYRLWQEGAAGARDIVTPYATLNTEDYEVLTGDTWVGSDPPDDAADAGVSFGAGTMSTKQRLSGYVNASASLVWRFVHIIDQTVNEAAGLAEADVLAALAADYARGVATGGRFNGDSVPSDPATAVP